MKYLVVQDWSSTHGNHAGMVHMCDMLVEKYPDQYVKIEKEIPPPMSLRRNLLLRRLFHKHDRNKYVKNLRDIFKEKYMNICADMFSRLKEGDEVFLLEYNLDEAPQFDLAYYIKSRFPYVKIYALTHLTPSNLKMKGLDSSIVEWDSVIDRELTLGSSLSNFLEEVGVSKKKISTGFHYVDSDYYHIDEDSLIPHKELTIITMGALQRDYNMLASIVKQLPEVNWIICRGRKNDVDSYFYDCENVELKGFLSEDELKFQMSRADASLNVLDDTVGSNVITTSMAMALVIIVSEVGSIRDYCDETNAVFCSNDVNAFVEGIRELSRDFNKIKSMRLASLLKSKQLGIENVHKWFCSLR